MNNLPRTRAEVITLSIIIEGGMVIGAYPLGWLLGVHPLKEFAFTLQDALLGLVATIPLLPIFLILIHGRIAFLKSLKDISLDMIRPMMRRCTLPDLIGISVLAGVGEEMVFRGVLQSWLGQDTSVWAALIAASLSFGLMHSMNRSYFILASLMGGYLGFLFIWTGNLLAPILVHLLYDTFALIYMTRIWEPFPEEEAAPIADEDTEDDFMDDLN